MKSLKQDDALAQQLERANHLMTQAEAVARMGAWELDIKRQIMEWTPGMRRLMQVPQSTASMTIEETYEFYTEESRAIVREAFEITMTRGTPYDLELEAMTRAGNRIWIREVCRATMYRGKLKSLIGVSRDITEQRHLAELVTRISNYERAQVGADLHDGLGQELTGLSMMLRALSKRAVLDKSPLLADIESICAVADQSAVGLRDISHQMLPVELRQLGLKGVLQSFTRSATATLGCSVTVSFLGEDPHTLDIQIAENLFRIAQEAVANAAKHGASKHIRLRVHVASSKTTLSVTDDGIGIDPKSASSGLGLQIMRYRARLLGGLLDVRASSSGGTQIRCVIPHRVRQ